MKKIWKFLFGESHFKQRTDDLCNKVRFARTGIEIDDCWQEWNYLVETYADNSRKSQILSDIATMILNVQKIV